MKNNCKLFFLATIVLYLSISINAQQQQPTQAKPTPPPITISQVRADIYEVKGESGANCGFFIGEKEVMVIDAKTDADSAKQMIAEIKKLTPKPIKYVLITHSDGDHVNGLTGFSQDITIIAQQQTRKDMDEAFKEPQQRLYLPGLTFSERLKIYSGNKVIELLYFGPAHTSGDVVVYFPDEKVAFIGDLFFRGRDPLIHRQKNGSSFGLVNVLKEILKLDADTFLNGHSDPAGKADIEGLIKSIEEEQSKIKVLIQEGKSLDEVKKAFNVEERPAQPGGRRFMSLVEVIYLELTEKK
jgi:glyoxylase-like metal-dependent hydrolase (beta-lactamase superfamily II)